MGDADRPLQRPSRHSRAPQHGPQLTAELERHERDAGCEDDPQVGPWASEREASRERRHLPRQPQVVEHLDRAAVVVGEACVGAGPQSAQPPADEGLDEPVLGPYTLA